MAVVAAYLAGLMTPLAAVLGVLGGTWWWRRLRRAQSVSEPIALEPWSPPTPLPPQDSPRLNRVSLRSVPGKRRTVHGRRR